MLVLRLDRQMSWDEIAHVTLQEAPSEEALRQEAGRLRQRFARAKQRLRTLAEAEGLLEPED